MKKKMKMVIALLMVCVMMMGNSFNVMAATKSANATGRYNYTYNVYVEIERDLQSVNNVNILTLNGKGSVTGSSGAAPAYMNVRVQYGYRQYGQDKTSAQISHNGPNYKTDSECVVVTLQSTMTYQWARAYAEVGMTASKADYSLYALVY